MCYECWEKSFPDELRDDYKTDQKKGKRMFRIRSWSKISWMFTSIVFGIGAAFISMNFANHLVFPFLGMASVSFSTALISFIASDFVFMVVTGKTQLRVLLDKSHKYC